MKESLKLLGIDTSSIACSVALSDGKSIFERHVEQPRKHTELILPMIKEVLSESKLELVDLDAIVLGNGPGSFIGMRIAASVSQGLAHGAGLDIIPVSSLSAVAAEALDASNENYIAVAQDAHMNEVYLGLYVRDKFNKPKSLVNEYLQEQGIIESFASQNQNFLTAGQGWKSYPELARSNSKWICGQSHILYPRATWLLALADISAAIKPQNIQPAYLRQKVAELPSNK
tara:strand:+ start:119 stop:808 length:690 start_codon:yes stop_codon:yes gene_type:complete